MRLDFYLFACYNIAMKKDTLIKKFKYRLTPLMLVLAIAVVMLCLGGIALSIYRLIHSPLQGFSDYLKSPLLIAISAFCIAVVVGILVKSQYVVTNEYYILQFGFIKSKYPIKDITSIILDSDTQKLTVNMSDGYTVLSLLQDENDEFVKTIQSINPNVEFSFTMTDGKNKK